MPVEGATGGLSSLSPQETLQFLNILGWSMAMSAALLLWAVLEKLDREARRESGNSDQDSTRERLFGRDVSVEPDEETEPPSEEASGRVERDEGRSDDPG